jgi:hypothetical protein
VAHAFQSAKTDLVVSVGTMPSLEAAMRRREFISLISGALAAAPGIALAQPGKKIPTIAYLWHAGSAKEETPYYEALLEGFSKLGYIGGRDFRLLHRFPNEMPERFRSMAAELVSMEVDVLMGGAVWPAGGMWRAAPVKAAKISRGELSQYRSKASLNGGGRPLAIACAIRLACSSVVVDFCWVRLIEAPPRIIGNDNRELVSFLSDLAISTHKIRALGVGQAEKELSGLAASCNSARALLTIWSLGYAYRVRSM